MNVENHLRRAPHGARGLKCPDPAGQHGLRGSRPAWGAWIEILLSEKAAAEKAVAPRMGRVD